MERSTNKKDFIMITNRSHAHGKLTWEAHVAWVQSLHHGLAQQHRARDHLLKRRLARRCAAHRDD